MAGCPNKQAVIEFRSALKVSGSGLRVIVVASLTHEVASWGCKCLMLCFSGVSGFALMGVSPPCET